MISSKIRFSGRGGLKYLFRNGTYTRGRYITVKTLLNPSRKSPRFAVIISKKVHKSAVGRNRVRRQTYEIIRKEMPLLKPGQDTAVIITSGDFLGLDSKTRLEVLRDCFNKSNLYK